MKRKLLCGLLAALALTCLSVKAAPSRVVPVQVDGTVLSQGVNYLENGVTYVSLRSLLNAFGGWSVWWDSGQKTAVASSGSQSLTADPAGDTMTVNGRTYSGKVFVERGRTYIPLRILVTALGGKVAWDPYLGGAAGYLVCTAVNLLSASPQEIPLPLSGGNTIFHYLTACALFVWVRTLWEKRGEVLRPLARPLSWLSRQAQVSGSCWDGRN